MTCAGTLQAHRGSAHNYIEKLVEYETSGNLELRECSENGVNGFCVYKVSAAGIRSANVIAKALRAGFHLIVHRASPVPLGSRERVTRYRVFSAAWSLGKCPLALTARRNRALRDSIAFVEHSTERTPRDHRCPPRYPAHRVDL